MSGRVTLKMIAEKAGVHFSTVSLALNDHPSIPQGTRERLRAVAEKLGYRPDPILAALVAYRVRKRKPAEHGVLAWLDAWPEQRSLRQLFPALWAGASDRAGRLGWKLEEFRMARQGLSPEKFSRMLRMRGIEGVLIPPLPGEGGVLSLDWTWFSSVVVSHTLVSPRLHRVMPHQLHNMQMLMAELRGLGYRRPGFALDQTINERVRHYWMAAYLDAQLVLPKTRRLEPFVGGAGDRRGLLAWMRRQEPDVIVSSRPEETLAVLKEAGWRVPEEVGVAGPAFTTESWNRAGASRRTPSTAGMDERFDTIGATAVDTLVGLIHRHERGVPDDAMHILIEGRWQPGETVRRQTE